MNRFYKTAAWVLDVVTSVLATVAIWSPTEDLALRWLGMAALFAVLNFVVASVGSSVKFNRQTALRLAAEGSETEEVR